MDHSFSIEAATRTELLQELRRLQDREGHVDGDVESHHASRRDAYMVPVTPMSTDTRRSHGDVRDDLDVAAEDARRRSDEAESRARGA